MRTLLRRQPWLEASTMGACLRTLSSQAFGTMARYCHAASAASRICSHAAWHRSFSRFISSMAATTRSWFLRGTIPWPQSPIHCEGTGEVTGGGSDRVLTHVCVQQNVWVCRRKATSWGTLMVAQVKFEKAVFLEERPLTKTILLQAALGALENHEAKTPNSNIAK